MSELITDWIETTSLPSVNYSPVLIGHNGKMYSIGGTLDVTNGLLNCYYTSINEDGSLGSWIETTPLPSNEFFYGALQIWNDRMYYFKRGVLSGSFLLFYAEINKDGTLGAWTTEVTPNRGYHCSIIHSGFIYMIGGATIVGGAQDLKCLYAPINPNGSIGIWKYTTADLNYCHILQCSVISSNGYIYAVAGQSNTLEARVEKCIPEKNGDILNWIEQEPLSTTTILIQHGVVTHNNKIYAINGRPETPGLPVGWTGEDIKYAQIESNGDISEWNIIPSSEYSVICGVTYYGGYIYEAGGISKATFSVTDKVYYTPILDINSEAVISDEFLRSVFNDKIKEEKPKYKAKKTVTDKGINLNARNPLSYLKG
jgi:hypothetical protein